MRSHLGRIGLEPLRAGLTASGAGTAPARLLRTSAGNRMAATRGNGGQAIMRVGDRRNDGRSCCPASRLSVAVDELQHPRCARTGGMIVPTVGRGVRSGAFKWFLRAFGISEVLAVDRGQEIASWGILAGRIRADRLETARTGRAATGRAIRVGSPARRRCP